MKPFTYYEYETYQSNKSNIPMGYDNIFRLKDELFYAEAADPETPSDFADIKYLRDQLESITKNMDMDLELYNTLRSYAQAIQ